MILAWTFIAVGATGLVWLLVAALCKAASNADRRMEEEWLIRMRRERGQIDDIIAEHERNRPPRPADPWKRQ